MKKYKAKQGFYAKRFVGTDCRYINAGDVLTHFNYTPILNHTCVRDSDSTILEAPTHFLGEIIEQPERKFKVGQTVKVTSSNAPCFNTIGVVRDDNRIEHSRQYLVEFDGAEQHRYWDHELAPEEKPVEPKFKVGDPVTIVDSHYLDCGLVGYISEITEAVNSKTLFYRVRIPGHSEKNYVASEIALHTVAKEAPTSEPIPEVHPEWELRANYAKGIQARLIALTFDKENFDCSLATTDLAEFCIKYADALIAEAKKGATV